VDDTKRCEHSKIESLNGQIEKERLVKQGRTSTQGAVKKIHVNRKKGKRKTGFLRGEKKKRRSDSLKAETFKKKQQSNLNFV